MAGGPNSTFEGDFSVSDVLKNLQYKINECTINQYQFLTNNLQNTNLKAVEGLSTRRPVPSTNQAIPSCFYFRIS